LKSDNPRTKALATKMEDEIASISMELESLKVADSTAIAPTTVTTPALSVSNNSERTGRKFSVRCNKVSCLQRKQERISEKLVELSDNPENPRTQAKVSKLTEKLAAISAKLEQMEKQPSDSSNSSLTSAVSENKKQQSEPSEISTDKQLVNEVKSKFFSMRREIHQHRMNIISLGKVLGALRVISHHGVSAGITFNDAQLAQTEVSLGIAKDEFAAKKTRYPTAKRTFR